MPVEIVMEKIDKVSSAPKCAEENNEGRPWVPLSSSVRYGVPGIDQRLSGVGVFETPKLV